LAGIPPFGGFFGKYGVFASAIQAGYVGVVLAAIVASIVGAVYYLRLLPAIFVSDDASEPMVLPLAVRVLAVIIIIGNLTVGALSGVILAFWGI
jgi:NADH-quinone oxidoreductase subunit N